MEDRNQAPATFGLCLNVYEEMFEEEEEGFCANDLAHREPRGIEDALKFTSSMILQYEQGYEEKEGRTEN